MMRYHWAGWIIRVLLLVFNCMGRIARRGIAQAFRGEQPYLMSRYRRARDSARSRSINPTKSGR
jgi:hypothetical protein